MNVDKLITTILKVDVGTAKKKYNSPKLIEYGNIADLTEFLNGGGIDAIDGSQPEGR